LVAAAEKDSERPLATAIVTAAAQRGLALPPATGFSSITGNGVRATADGHEVLAGTTRLLSDTGIDSSVTEKAAARFAEQGRTAILARGLAAGSAGLAVRAQLSGFARRGGR
jgi:Cu+-exporting ATPase